MGDDKFKQSFLAIQFVRGIPCFPDAVRADDNDIFTLQSNRIGLVEFSVFQNTERHTRVFKVAEFTG